MRSISRIIPVSLNTVYKMLVDAGQFCAVYHDQHVRNVVVRRVQCDEIWSFCYAKQKTVNQAPDVPNGSGDVWTWTAIDSDSKLILAYEVGDRSMETGLEFLENLQGRLANPVHITTDRYNVYLSAVEQVFGDDVEHALMTKGEEGGPTTSHVERQNLTMRMGMRRFTRRTNGFSKRIERHLNMLSLYFVYYNFVRVHSSISKTPAQAAGLTETDYDMEWLAEQIEAARPKPNRPKTYKKRQISK